MERKLRLVPPVDGGGSAPIPPAPPEPEDDAVISDEERAAAEALRDALDRGEEAMAADLQAAFAPRPLVEADLDAILARAMGDESAATQAERAAADRVRGELAGEAPLRETEVLQSLRMAAAPPALDPAKNEAMIEAALARAAEKRVIPIGRRVRRLAPVTIAALTTVTALAASFALFFGQPRLDPPGAASAALIRARSTQELFDASTPFPRSGEESARIDRIAAARASDLRANRFAAWGVR